VVVFWNSSNIYSVEEIRDLGKGIAQDYAEKGLRVVAVNEGDNPRINMEKFKSTGATFQNLLDLDGLYFAKIATEELPRTYLLDADGKILWFDTEYSRSTRRDLLQAIQVALGEI